MVLCFIDMLHAISIGPMFATYHRIALLIVARGCCDISERAVGSGETTDDRFHEPDGHRRATLCHGREKRIFQKRRAQRCHHYHAESGGRERGPEQEFGLRRDHCQFHRRCKGRLAGPGCDGDYGWSGPRVGRKPEHQKSGRSQREKYRHQQFRRRAPQPNGNDSQTNTT